MSKQSWIETLATQDAVGTLFNTYTTAKSVINPAALWAMPVNYLTPGKKFRIRIVGAVSNIVTTPGLMNFQVKMGPTANIVVFDTGNIQLNASVHVTLPFWLDLELTVRSVGSGTAATIMGQGQITGKMFTTTAGQTDSAQDMPTLMVPAGIPAVGTGFDSTVANLVDIWAGFTINAAGNGVQIHQYSFESLN